MSGHFHWRLVHQLYTAASELEGSERSRYLDEQCANPAVRLEVERMLSSVPGDITGVGSSPRRGIELPPGTQLGHYEVQNKIGSGGMGVVYQALDQNLNRPVAIKILSASHFGGEDARRRFAREAQTASGLNHPNIVTVYEVGHEKGFDFIVMERILGQTLHRATPPRGLELREALRYAIQITDALAVAHEAGIVHRDLKPGNIMITERGLVKVLDFGLAKVTVKRHASAADDEGDSPTATEPLTEPGLVMGTISYMSPEQAEGREVDGRSDIFSFGCVIYKMLSGSMAHHGASYASTIASVLTQDPAPLRQLKPGTPPALEQIVRKCLQKKPADRWQHMSDVKLMLEDVLRDLESGATADNTETAPLAARNSRVRWLDWAVAAACGAAMAAGGAWFMLRPPPDTALTQTTTMLTADAGLSAYPALSKDGSLLAFASDRGGAANLDIWVQQVGGRDAIQLTRDDADESAPSISPDGTKVAFRSEKNGGSVYVTPALGGDPILVAPEGRDPRFSPDGRTIAYWTGRSSAGFVPGSASIFLVEAGGGAVRLVSGGLAAATHPVWSPKGDELLVLGRKDAGGKADDSLDWWILPVAGGAPRKTGALARLNTAGFGYVGGGSHQPLAWLANSELKSGGGGSRVLFSALLGESSNLWELGLTGGGLADGSMERLTLGPGRQTQAAEVVVKGEPRTVMADLSLNYDIWTELLDRNTGLTRGDASRLTEALSVERSPSLSADGKLMAFTRSQGANWSLRVMDLATRRERILVNSERQIGIPKLSGNGGTLAYCDDAQVAFAIPSQGGTAERLFDGCGAVMDISFDGKRILYEPLEDEHLTLYDTQLRQKVILARRPTDTVLSGSRFSPDGKWVAFHSIDRASKQQLWIVRIDGALPAPRSEWIAVTDGTYVERDPAWPPSGAMLYYLSERDGFRCIWARRLDPSSKKPSGDRFPVEHFHSVRRSLAPFGTRGYHIGLSVAADRMVFALTELKGNLWLREAAR